MQSAKKENVQINLLDTPIFKLLIRLSIPSVITMLVTNIYNLADTSFVGRLGTSASGAVGIVFGFMAIIQAFGFLFGQGAGSLLSRALGRKDKASASCYASVGFFFSFLSGLLISVFGFIFIDDIILFLGSTKTIFPYAKIYISYILIACPFMGSSLSLNNFLRYEGKARLGMIGLMVGAILNIVLDPILMFGFGLGIHGAGISTAFSQIVSFLILAFMFISGKTETRISLKSIFHTRFIIFADIVGTGLPSLLRQGLNSLSTVILNAQCAHYGDAAVAGMSIVSRLIFFVFSVALGVGQGFQPIAAYNYGARKYTRIRKGFKCMALISTSVILVGSTFLIIFSKGCIALFRDDIDVIKVGSRALILQALASPFLPVCMAIEMLMQSTGRKLYASVLSALRNGLLFIPAIYVLSHLRGLHGIEEAQPLSIILALPFTLFLGIRFFKNLPKQDA